MTREQREKVLEVRKQREFPWHGPPHRTGWQTTQYLISAACFEHRPIVGTKPERMDEFTGRMRSVFADAGVMVHAWCVLPNHYHALVTASDVVGLMKRLGKLHGGTSFVWNGEDGMRGKRHCWHRATDRAMRGERHFWATLNYVHHNPVRHGYVKKWQHWPWSSVHEYMAEVGREEVETIWKTFPVLEYGDGWDDPDL